MDGVARLVLQEMVYELPRVLFGPLVRKLRGLPSSEWDQTFNRRFYQKYALRFVQKVLLGTSFVCLWQQTWVPSLATVLASTYWVVKYQLTIDAIQFVVWAVMWMLYWMLSSFYLRD